MDTRAREEQRSTRAFLESMGFVPIAITDAEWRYNLTLQQLKVAERQPLDSLQLLELFVTHSWDFSKLENGDPTEMDLHIPNFFDFK